MTDKYFINLSEEQIDELERLSALGYTPEEMAIFFNKDKISFVQAAHDVESYIYYHIKRGQIVSAAKEQMAILAGAEKGEVDASKQLGNIRRSRGWEISKMDIFGGFEHKGTLEKLQDYIQGGSINKLSAEEAIYIEALTLFNSMSRKYGRRNTIIFFTRPPFNLKYARAAEMYDEAINLFYTDRNVEKKALRNLLADQLGEAAIIVRDNALEAKDWKIYGELIMQQAKLQELDRPDVEKLPKEAYMKPVRVLSMDPEFIGLGKIDRQLIANQIEQLEIPERDKTRLRGDAAIEQLNLAERLNELEEESQSE